MTRAVLIALGITFLVPSASAWADTYTNDFYGYSVPIPQGLSLCPFGDPESLVNNHGAAILLEGGPEDCGKSRATVGMMAFWDVLEDMPAEDVIKRSCETPKGGSKIVNRRFKIAKLRSVTCERRFPDGSLEIRVAAVSTTRDQEGFPTETYTVSLDTDPLREAEDIAAFKKILQSFRICTPKKDCLPAP